MPRSVVVGRGRLSHLPYSALIVIGSDGVVVGHRGVGGCWLAGVVVLGGAEGAMEVVEVVVPRHPTRVCAREVVVVP